MCTHPGRAVAQVYPSTTNYSFTGKQETVDVRTEQVCVRVCVGRVGLDVGCACV